ncbi:MAG TPA: CarD family transcriptional regulator [Holophaga sp.]|nr:CarD family transcriptional regulator [Holophaga sp.]
MFNINDHVFYSSVGVCRISDIRAMKLGGAEEQKCYVLKLFKDPNSTIFVPTDNVELLRNMRAIMTKDEIEALIQDMPSEDTIWINNERERGTTFFEKARSCDSRELVKLVKTLYLERVNKKEKGKNLSTTDSRIMAIAEKLLYEEFAFVLNIDPKDVIPFIRERVPQAL